MLVCATASPRAGRKSADRLGLSVPNPQQRFESGVRRSCIRGSRVSTIRPPTGLTKGIFYSLGIVIRDIIIEYDNTSMDKPM